MQLQKTKIDGSEPTTTEAMQIYANNKQTINAVVGASGGGYCCVAGDELQNEDFGQRAPKIVAADGSLVYTAIDPDA